MEYVVVIGLGDVHTDFHEVGFSHSKVHRGGGDKQIHRHTDCIEGI
jgi:hypothetical protein